MPRTVTPIVKNGVVTGLTFSNGFRSIDIHDSDVLMENSNIFDVSIKQSNLIADPADIYLLKLTRRNTGASRTHRIGPTDSEDIMTVLEGFVKVGTAGGRRTRRHKRKAKKTRKSRNRNRR